MNLRRDLELWTFNIVETAIDYEDFESWTKCILHYAMFKYGPHRLMCLNAWPIGSGTIRRCGLVGVGVSLWVWALRPSS